METNQSVEELLKEFYERGGKIDQFYLNNNSRRTGQTLVYLNGWYSGKNVREAITKAFAG